ncbi:MAG: hypothetical protein Q9218_007449 [Villophora microphyllina]
MLLPCFAPVPLSDKIEAWRQKVVRQTPEPQVTNRGACDARSSHGMKLRSSATRTVTSHSPHNRHRRPALAEISLPNQPTKRKASNLGSKPKKRQKMPDKGAKKSKLPRPSPIKGQGEAHDDEDYTLEGQGSPTKRGPGRPRKIVPDPREFTVRHQTAKVGLNDAPSLASSDPKPRKSSRSRQSSKSRNTSPEKTPSTPRGRKMDDELKKGDLVTSYLEKCKPPVFLRDVGEISGRYGVPKEVRQLLDLLEDIPTGSTIPPGLRQAYDLDNTPRGSKPAPHNHQYSSLDNDPFPIAEHDYLKNFTTRIMQRAKFSARMDAHEGQWGNIVCRVLNVFDLWPEGDLVESISVQTEPIAPIELRPNTHKAGAAPVVQGQNSKGASTTSGSEGSKDSTLDKMVDWVMALTLSWDNQRYLQKAFATIPEINQHSVNQTRGFTHLSPFWLYLELKKHYQAIDPRIQLAVFAAAGIAKKNYMGWDTMFPTPGITVEGHQWRLYIFFEVKEGNEGEIMMMGPLKIGSTENRIEMWHLLRSLYALVTWGGTQYRQWFEHEIINWAKRTVSS